MKGTRMNTPTRMTAERAMGLFGPDWRRRMVGVWRGRWTYHYLDGEAQVLHTSSDRQPDIYALQTVVESLGFVQCTRCKRP